MWLLYSQSLFQPRAMLCRSKTSFISAWYFEVGKRLHRKRTWMRSIFEWLERRLPMPESQQSCESEGRQMKQCWILSKVHTKIPPVFKKEPGSALYCILYRAYQRSYCQLVILSIIFSLHVKNSLTTLPNFWYSFEYSSFVTHKKAAGLHKMHPPPTTPYT
jgi:hypothetical protein